jgi:hypothetical protein
MENYLDGPETPDEVDDFRQATEAYSGIGCAGCVIVMLLGIAVAIGFILLFIHILNHYRV